MLESQFTEKSTFKRQVRRLRRHVAFISWTVLASLIPPAVFLGAVYYEDLRVARNSLQSATEQGAQRIDTLLREGDRLLKSVAQNIDIQDPEAEEKLEKLVYESPLFREIGIIDNQGFLVLTSLGRLEPPVWIMPDHRSSPQKPELQILGPLQTAVMQEASIILSLPTNGAGEVNALVNPVILTEPWGYVFVDGDFGQDGFFAYVNIPTGQVLASRGKVPPIDVLNRAPTSDRIRVTRTSQNGDVLIISEVSKRAVLSKWRRIFWVGGPITALTSGILVFLSVRVVQRSEGLDQELIIGLDNQELVFHYQPIMHLETRTCIGSEALLRWYHPEHGVLSPDLFIPVAEKTGFIDAIGIWSIKQIAREQAHLYKHFPELYTSINVSPKQVHSGNLESILALLQNTSLCSPERFLFEVTETTTVLSQGTTTADILARLRTAGTRIALDDFGQGYSNLSYLHQLDVDALKIDRFYVSAIHRDPQLTQILESILELGNKLGLLLIAEGIETEEQYQFLYEHGVTYGQGWLFSRPLPINEFEQFLRSNLSQPQ